MTRRTTAIAVVCGAGLLAAAGCATSTAGHGAPTPAITALFAASPPSTSPPPPAVSPSQRRTGRPHGARYAAPPNSGRRPASPGLAPGAPDPARTDLHNPNAVAATFAVASNAADTRIDGGPNDTEIRASRLLTPTQAAYLQANRITTPPTGNWDAAAAHHAYAVCSAQRDYDDQAGKKPTPGHAYLVYAVTCTWHGRTPTSWRAPAAPALLGGILYMNLAPDAHHNWHITGLNTIPAT